MKNLSLFLITLIILTSGFGAIFLSVNYFGKLIDAKKDNQDSVLGTSNSNLLKVSKVIDGDTIKVEIDGQIKTVRLIGVDTPEVDSGVTDLECFGNEASSKTKELLNGKLVKLEADLTQANQDKYGRLLRYVYLEGDLESINEKLIKQGYAFEYTYKVPYKLKDKFDEAEDYARENEVGLWGEICK